MPAVQVSITAILWREQLLKCACRDFHPTFKAAGKAWSKVPAAERDTHFFASIDFEDGQDVFRDVRAS